MITLEQYFRSQFVTTKDGWQVPAIDHALRCEIPTHGPVRFYIHPANVNGDTLNFEVQGNCVVPDPKVRRFINVWLNAKVYAFYEDTMLSYELLRDLLGLTGFPTCVAQVRGRNDGNKILHSGEWLTLENNMIIDMIHTDKA